MTRLEELRRFLAQRNAHAKKAPDEITGQWLEEGSVAYARASTLTMLLWVAEAVKPWIREDKGGVYLNSPYLRENPDQVEALKALKEMKDERD